MSTITSVDVVQLVVDATVVGAVVTIGVVALLRSRKRPRSAVVTTGPKVFHPNPDARNPSAEALFRRLGDMT